MSQTTELVLAEETTALQVFSTEGGLSPIIKEAHEFVAVFEHDLSTAAGRKRTASLAAKVAKLKVRLDGMGKDLVSDWKDQAKKVDQSRKSMRDSLDELKIDARKPLTDWEDDQERIKTEKLEQLAAERLAAEIETAHEMALLIDENINRGAAEAAAEIERLLQEEKDEHAREQAEREERLKHEAAENARIEAEQKAQIDRNRIEQERLDALRREQEARNRADQAGKDRIAAEERAKQQKQERIKSEAHARIQAEQAETNRKKAEEQAEINRKESEERARQQEIQRQQDELDRIQAEKDRRNADRANVSAVLKAIKEALMVHADLDEDQARSAVMAMRNGHLPSVTINY